MKRTRPVMLAALGASAVMLAGCASSTRAPQRAGTTASVGSRSLPAGMPLTTRVNPRPAELKPIDTTIARDFAADQIERVLSLDAGAFRADPAPRNVVPKISAALAFCNLLAGATVENVTVIEGTAQHGMSCENGSPPRAASRI